MQAFRRRRLKRYYNMRTRTTTSTVNPLFLFLNRYWSAFVTRAVYEYHHAANTLAHPRRLHDVYAWARATSVADDPEESKKTRPIDY